MKVYGARLVIKEHKKDPKSKSGILIAGADKEPTYQGTVIAVGNGAMLENGTRVPLDIKVGDEVVYQAYSGSPVVENGETFIILNERDVLCSLD